MLTLKSEIVKSQAVKLTASQKRAKQDLERAYAIMNRETRPMRERYYDSAVSYNQKQIERDIKFTVEKMKDYSDHDSTYINLNRTLTLQRESASRVNINSLLWLKQAEETFNSKLSNISERLVGFGMMDGVLKVQRTWIEDRREFSFLIESYKSSWDKKNGCTIKTLIGTAHARLVWVSCFEKVSHWRFIITKRTK